MTIVEFFDPFNVEHVKAYIALEKTGQWPEGFVPACILNNQWPNIWQIQLQAKMAQAWIKQVSATCGW